MELEETRELNPLFEERERRRRAESLLSLVEAELDDARLARRFAVAFAALATGATLALIVAVL